MKNRVKLQASINFFLEQLSIEKIKLSTPYTETQDG